MRKKKMSMSDFIMDAVIILILLLVTIICLYPVWYVLMASFSSSSAVAKSAGMMLWPEDFTMGAYKLVFESKLFTSGFINSIKVLLLSLPLNIFLTMLAGYFMARTGMMFKKPIVLMIMFTMYFSGGLVPGYINVKSLGLFNTVWALVLPGALSVYNAIICKTAIEAVPDSLRESAHIDGANDFQVIFKIILPLIKPTLAVLLLYYGVAHWNAWFQASIYITKNDLLPIQNILRGVLLQNQDSVSGDNYNAYAETIKYAAVVVSTAPILCIYPFLQKYFTKGVMIGAVKG